MKNEIKSSLRNATYQIREISAGLGAGLIALEIGAGPSDQADSYGLTAKGEEIARERWGVFQWQAENQYRTPQAIKIYKREGAAQKCADRMNAEPRYGELVVRKLR